GFSGDPAAYEVRMISGDNITTAAQVTEAKADELRMRVPFGAASGNVVVKLGDSESQSPTLLSLGTSVSGFVQEAVKQQDGSTKRQPIAGMKMRAEAGTASVPTTTNTDGAFVFKFPPSVTDLLRVNIYLNVDGALPYSNETRSMRGMGANRDNQYSGDFVD